MNDRGGRTSRRRFLRGGAAAVIGGVAGCGLPPEVLRFASPILQPFVDTLPHLPVITGDAPLVASVGRHHFHRDLPPVPTFRYNDLPVLGPTVEGHAGTPSHHLVTNSLGPHVLARDLDPSIHGTTPEDATAPRTCVHLHGGVTEPAHDGHPEDTFRPGASRTYRYGHRQEAATLWYHDHAMGITRLNVYAGLAGLYLLRDEWDTGRPGNPLGLPAGEDELPFVLSDRGFEADGRLRFRTVPAVPEGSWEGGMIGDTMTVNGTVWPVVDLGRGVYRLRMVNACNLVTLRLRCTGGVPFHVIGNDLGLLDAPARTPEVVLSAGERLDVLLDTGDLEPGTTFDLVNTEDTPAQARLFALEKVREVARFRVGSGRSAVTAVPARLRGGYGRPARLPASVTPVRERLVTVSQLLAERNPPAFMTLDNLAFHSPQRHMARPRQGTTELWSIINTTPDDHPIHLHLVGFRVVDRTVFDAVSYQLLNPRPMVGDPWTPDPARFLFEETRTAAAPWESGVKDTVRVPGGTVTRILVTFPTEEELGFDPDEAFPLPGGGEGRGYVWHCHILDHEDNEMMLPYRLGG